MLPKKTGKICQFQKICAGYVQPLSLDVLPKFGAQIQSQASHFPGDLACDIAA